MARDRYDWRHKYSYMNIQKIVLQGSFTHNLNTLLGAIIRLVQNQWKRPGRIYNSKQRVVWMKFLSLAAPKLSQWQSIVLVSWQLAGISIQRNECDGHNKMKIEWKFSVIVWFLCHANFSIFQKYCFKYFQWISHHVNSLRPSDAYMRQ